MQEILELMKSNNINAVKIEKFQENHRVSDYLIDRRVMLRLSKSALDEVLQLQRVKTLDLVPKVHASGSWTILDENYHYMICDYIVGKDLFDVLPELTDRQIYDIGLQIAEFLEKLHGIGDTCYDVGHYVPTIPRFLKTWREGHEKYVEILKTTLSTIDFSQENKKVIDEAFAFLNSNMSCLDQQIGARLIHNDLHPKNIIINEGKLAGIIDWECSQFGEQDFELSHLIHWCIYPPDNGMKFEPLIRAIFESSTITHKYDDIQTRLTVYQLEHELNQLIWNGKNQEAERIFRIKGWLENKIGEVF
ncbi:MAG: phosphotransferase [Clostridiales bacterium]|nr:phosphotransferase [Clostridiales bacterium]